MKKIFWIAILTMMAFSSIFARAAEKDGKKIIVVLKNGNLRFGQAEIRFSVTGEPADLPLKLNIKVRCDNKKTSAVSLEQEYIADWGQTNGGLISDYDEKTQILSVFYRGAVDDNLDIHADLPGSKKLNVGKLCASK